jgi:hypothetical protein
MRCARTVRGEDSVGVNVNTTQAGATTVCYCPLRWCVVH